MLGRALPLRDVSGEVAWWFGTCTDIEELKVALAETAVLREELERRATHDPLTGLANRDLLFDRTESMLQQRRRTGVAVVFIDLDWSKQVNDRLGHRAGDRLSCTSLTAFDQRYAMATSSLISVARSSWWSDRPMTSTTRNTLGSDWPKRYAARMAERGAGDGGRQRRRQLRGGR